VSAEEEPSHSDQCSVDNRTKEILKPFKQGN